MKNTKYSELSFLNGMVGEAIRTEDADNRPGNLIFKLALDGGSVHAISFLM